MIAHKFYSEIVKLAKSAPSWCATTSQYDVHPLVLKLIVDGVEPADIAQLVFEWPHKSETGDPSMVAYARDERSHKERRYTRTKLGKYIKRHFPSLEDHKIRDLVASYAQPHEFKVFTDIRDMVAAALFGPHSCMRWDDEDMGAAPYESAKKWWRDRYDDGSGWEFYHPYCVYDPELGWGVAVRISNGQIVGRAVVHMGRKIFVRTYVLRSDPHAQSSDDDYLKSWLESQGYQKVPYWPEGVEFARRDNGRSQLFMPYIDADCDTHRRVAVVDDKVVRNDYGPFVAKCTDGDVFDADPEGWCTVCGMPIYDPRDAHEAWRNGTNVHVCPNCIEPNFVWANWSTRYRGDYEGLIYAEDIVPVYFGPTQRITLWDEYRLPMDVVRLDVPAEIDGTTCWYSLIGYTMYNCHGQRVIIEGEE